MLSEITVINAPRQRLDTYLSDTAVSIELFHNETTKRWSLSLDIAGVRALSGVRLVPDTDVLAGYRFGIGRLVMVDCTNGRPVTHRDGLPSGAYRLIHDDGRA